MLTIDKFIGGLHIPAVTSSTQLDPSECEDALNVEFYPRGAVSQRAGYRSSVVSSTTGSGFTRLYKWKAGSTNYQLGWTCSAATVSATMGTLNLTNGVYTILVSAGADGWSPEYDDAIDVTAYGGSAISTYKDATKAPFTFNGTAASAQTSMFSGTTCLAGFGNYLFVANHLVGGQRKASRLSWNSAGDISTWPVSYYIELDSDDGDEITCVRLLGEYLVVFKRHKIFIVYWVGGPLLFKEARRAVTAGCVGPNAAVEHEGKIIFMSDDGVYSFDGTAIQEISKRVRPLFQRLNPAYVHLIEAYKVIDKKQIWFCVPYNVGSTATSTKNYVFVWDYELDNWTKFDIACSSISLFVDAKTTTYGDLGMVYSAETRTFASYLTIGAEKLYLGFLSGSVSQFGEGATLDNTSVISSTWKSKWFDLDSPTSNKRLLRMTLLIDKKAQGDLRVDLQEDWKDNEVADSLLSWTGTKTVSMTGDSTADLLERRIDATRQARAFQIVLSGDSVGNPWSLHKMWLDIIQKGRTFVGA